MLASDDTLTGPRLLEAIELAIAAHYAVKHARTGSDPRAHLSVRQRRDCKVAAREVLHAIRDVAHVTADGLQGSITRLENAWHDEATQTASLLRALQDALRTPHTG